MSIWTPLLPLAMVGTDRQASPVPSWPGEVGQLLAQVADANGNPATAVLRAAAVLAACDLAATQGILWTEPLPAAASDDALPSLPDGPVSHLVAWSLNDGPARLQHEVCIALARARCRLPTALLPQALELGRRSLSLRPLLSPVLGERGLWLAAQRDDWRFAAGISAEAPQEAQWNEGSFEQRRNFLRQERAADPQAARERLAGVLDELGAKERADLAAELSERLNLDDEPLLDTLRADRSREVRQAAGNLLLRLPDAAHPKRAMARMDALLKHERVLLRKRWQIDAPASAASDWKADNLDAVRPKNESLGERAWWLYQLVRQVPLGWWTQHTGMSPAELLHWAHETDWTEALLRGWRDVLFAATDMAWCEAFLDKWPSVALRDDPATVLALLPPAARERHWLRQLREGGTSIHLVVNQVLVACPAGQTLSASLSATLVDAIRRRAESRALNDDYALRGLLPDLCCALHADALQGMSQLARHPDETTSLAEVLQVTTHVVAVRQALHSLTISGTP